MAQRPERRKSALGAAHPIEHQNSQPTTPETTVVDESHVLDTSAAGRGVVERAARSGQPGKPKVQPKGSFYADEDVLERIRAAWFHTPTTAAEREASFSDFLREAALDRMLKRENTYNNGNPFPVVASGKIARGRR
ncbi:hypothetical protein [Arthrobacter sp. 31Y]|uniref:hypothetical protein n=1 Tax=Arthrobacter sp. 31Y TaxID=1115632 RepID=UPI00163B15A4|nr:hypothetical protein [Arthrobacter sp. 31Y]